MKALEEQRRQLKEHEGSNRKVERKIEKELKWVQKVDPARADKEARRAGFDVEEPAPKPKKEEKAAAAAAPVKKEEAPAPAAAAAAASASS